MQAIRFQSGGRVECCALDTRPLQHGEVLLRVRAAGLCHTDYEILRGNYGARAFPLVPCHEFAGEIVALGAGVAPSRLGARVSVSPNLGCGTCDACRNGRINLCSDLGAYGVTQDGGFAEYCVLRADRAVDIGDLPYDIAALAEPLGCVLNGLSPIRHRLSQGEISTALIFGAGPMGILMALALQDHGVRRVVICDPDPARRRFASSFGVEPRDIGFAAQDSQPQGYDLVVEATGRIAVAAALIDHAKNGGAILFFGVCPADQSIALSPFDMFRRQISAHGTHSLNDPDLPAAIALLQRIGAPARRLISHVLTLEEMAQVLRSHPPAGALKLQVQFE